MVGASVRRGLLAGAIAGLLAGLFALLVASPPLDAAIVLEAAADHGHAGEDTFSRATQRLGLVLGTALFGTAMGAVFGVVAAAATGRLRGDAWARSCTLATVAIISTVVLPALATPPNPPGVGDPDTVALRSVLYLAVAATGLVIAVMAWWSIRRLHERGLSLPAARAVALSGALILAGLLLASLPDAGPAGDFPAELLWQFRLGSLGTQVVLWGSLGVTHGLLSARHDRTAVGAVRSAGMR
jgi:hypothetical protein